MENAPVDARCSDSKISCSSLGRRGGDGEFLGGRAFRGDATLKCRTFVTLDPREWVKRYARGAEASVRNNDGGAEGFIIVSSRSDWVAEM